MEAQTMHEPVDARIFKTRQKFQVHPDVVIKHKGEYFTLFNFTLWPVHVTFHDLPIDPAADDIGPLTPRTYKILEARPGVYEYSVVIKITDVDRNDLELVAQAGSNPKIIIDF